MTDDRKRPMAERIAALDVKSSYRDIRDGIGPGGVASMTDQDIAAALGMVKSAIGIWPVFAVETYFGSTLRHERRLRDRWSDLRERSDDTRTARILSRFSCAIAIRQFAGIVHVEGDMAEYAYLMVLRPIDFRKSVNDVLAWLEELKSEGLTELRKKCRETRAALDSA